MEKQTGSLHKGYAPILDYGRVEVIDSDKHSSLFQYVIKG